MLLHDRPIGAIAVARHVTELMSESQIELLKTFADQAVIAIENARLFNETKEALEQQTATSEILQVISRVHNNVQPVFDAIADSAARLCSADLGGMFLVQDGQLCEVSTWSRHDPGLVETLRRVYPRPLDRSTFIGRSIMERQVFQIADMTDSTAPQSVVGLDRLGFRSQLSVPILRDGDAIGGIAVVRHTPGLFSEDQIQLLKTFADQAVIAIENVRLFKELESRNRDLAEALNRQTATAEILRVISQSPTDAQPVFDTIVHNAVLLCSADHGNVFRFDGRLLHWTAAYNVLGEPLEQFKSSFPRPVSEAGGLRDVLSTGGVQRMDDVDEDDAPFSSAAQFMFRALGVRSALAVPMSHRGCVVGAIALTDRAAHAFTDTHVELLKTFADQAVIAIENARLFNELQARTQELTRSVGQLTALGEVGRAVSSTLDLETVLTTIVSRAVELSGLDGGVVFEYDDGAEEFVLRVATETGGALGEARRTARIRKGEGVLGRTAITLEPVQVPDIAVPGAYEGRLRENLIESGIRAILAVPMVREGRLIGCLGVTRNHPGEFPVESIELLRTFATQSALAIQNARLFREIAEKSRQLEVASQHKSEFLANMSHELRTPLNAVIGFSEVLTDRMFGELNEKQEEYLKDIHASGQHLLSLISDILDLSKIEAGRMELELTDFDMPTAIENALTLVRERAGRRSIALHMNIDNRLGQIQADERKVRQVVLNLLSNAIKFTPEGGRIEVLAAPKDGSVEVSVSDTGVGIAPEDQETVFEEFRQVGTAAKKVEGTGLGLTLCRKFVELHGGRIWVKSEVGTGSTFTFTLPARRGE
jgi:signal transduction histidine kinase